MIYVLIALLAGAAGAWYLTWYYFRQYKVPENVKDQLIKKLVSRDTLLHNVIWYMKIGSYDDANYLFKQLPSITDEIENTRNGKD